MDNDFEEMLREDMDRKTESVFLPDDMVEGAERRHQRRRKVRRRLVAGGGALAVVIVAAGLVFGVALARGGDRSSGSKVAGTTGSATSPIGKDGKLTVTFLTKVLAAATASDDEILHFVITESATASTPKIIDEFWQIAGSKWKLRHREVVASDHYESDSVADYSGAFQSLEKNGTIQEDKGMAMGQMNSFLAEFTSYIKEKLDSGEAVKAGHQTVNGRDTVCFQWTDPGTPGLKVTHTYFLDPVSGELVRVATDGPSDVRSVADYGAYYKLPATAENLKLLDLRAVYPNAKVVPASPAPKPTTYPRSALPAGTLDGTEILHVKVTVTSTSDGSDSLGPQTDETWSTGDKRWAVLVKDTLPGGSESETLEDYTGHFLFYDNDSVREQDVPNPENPAVTDGYKKEIDKMIASGQAAKGQHEQIDGRDAVRVAFTSGEEHVVALLDARTYKPIEFQSTYTTQFGSNGVIQTSVIKQTTHVDVYEKLPATAENLKMFNLRAFHSDKPITKD